MITFWFLLALLSSFIQALKEISIKNNLKNLDWNTLIFILSGLSLILWFPFVLYNWIPDLSSKFFIVFFLSWFLFYIWKLFNFKALQIEDISYISPLKSLISIFVLFLWIIILNEIPNIFWLIGLLLVLIWLYLLNIQKYHKKFIEPIVHIFKNKGSQFFLVTIFCYGFTNIFDKIWVLETNPIFWIFVMNLFLFFVSLKNFLKDFSKNKEFITKRYKSILITFLFYSTSHITQMASLQYIFASYVSVIKSSSMLFVIIIWWIFFKEKDLLRKFFIWLLILVWIIFIYFW